MQIKNKHSIIIIILLLIFLVFEGIYLYVLPNFFDINKRIPAIEKIYKEKTGATLDIETIKLSTYADFSVGLKSKKLVAYTPDNKKVVEADDIFIKVNLLPLIFRNLALEKVSAKYFDADVKRYTNGEFNIETLIPKSKEKIFNLKIKNTKFNISKYNIKFTDKKFDKNFQINGSYFKISNLTMEKLIDLETQGNITSSGLNTEFQVKLYSKLPVVKNISNSSFVVSGFVKNVEPKAFEPYIKEYLDKNIQKVEGKASFNFYTKKLKNKENEIVIEGVVNDLLIKKPLLEDTVLAPGKNILSAKLIVNDKKININSFYIKGINYRLELDGLIKDYKTKKPYLDINARIPKSRAESITSILPSNIIPQREEIRKVKRYGMFGDIEAKVNIKGKIPRPDITGTVNGTNLHIVRGFENTHTGEVNLTFEKRILHTNVLIKVNSGEYAKVKGKTYIYRDKENHFVITSSKNIELPLTQKLLLPIQDVFLFQLGPIPQMKFLGGTGSVNLDIVGTKLSGVVKGNVSFKNASASYNGIDAVLTNGNGSVDFYGKKILYKTTHASIQNYPVTIFGSAIINKDVDFNITTNSVNSKILLNVVNKSELLQEIKEKLTTITDVSGLCDFKLNIKADISNYNSIMAKDPKEALKDMKVKGTLTLKNAKGYLQGFRVPLNNIKGSVDFSQTSVKLNNLTAKVENSPVKIYGEITNNLVTNTPTVNIFAESNKIMLQDSIKFLLESDLSKDLKQINLPLNKISGQHDLFLNYTATSKDFDINAITIKSNFQNIPSAKPPAITSGRLTLDNGVLKIENLNTKVYNTVAKISGKITQLSSKQPFFDLLITANNVNLTSLNTLNKYSFIQPSLKNILDQYENFSGKADLSVRLNNASANGNIKLTDLKFTHKLSNTPITINHTTLKLESSKLTAESIDANIGNAPFHSDFTISNILTKPSITGYITTKITNEFVENYINTKLTYPIKVKGDIDLTADFSGDLDSYEIEHKIRFNEGSDLSYLSANLGDQNDTREMVGNVSISPNFINVKKFEYIKYITSQNNKTYPVTFATIKGNLQKINNKFEIDSLLLKTNNQLPTRLLNFAFKKSILKHGTFNCALFYKANTRTHVPKIFGNIDFKNMDIPLYDTVIKDISIDSDRNVINLNVKGISFDSDFTINSKLANRLVLPIDIKDITVTSEKLNFDKLIDNLSKMSLESYQNKTNQPIQTDFNFNSFLIEKGHFGANDISFKSLPAKNLKADFSFDKKSLLKVNNLSFDVAGGTLSGEGEYNATNRTLETTLYSKDVDANLMSDALFNMKGQLYGKMDGQLYIRTKGSSQEERLKNLSGLVYFNIKEGRMPKLGSLEYLLRASNIVKSGVTGLTINSIIDIINPVKTGHFSAINGSFSLDDGIAKNIEIYSKGENLSIYVKGKCDLVNSNADMRVLGKLSNKITNLLGPIGNTSINSIFNLIPKIALTDPDRAKFMKDISKVPGLDFTNADYRVFQAKIDGNINGNAYVSSFKWIE